MIKSERGVNRTIAPEPTPLVGSCYYIALTLMLGEDGPAYPARVAPGSFGPRYR